MFYNLRDEVGNKIVQWIMKHIHCYASTFYTCCSCYYPADVKCMSESFLTTEKGKEKDDQKRIRRQTL